MSFQEIKTQEEFDEAIKERLTREKEKYSKEIEKLTEEIKEKDETLSNLQKANSELEEKNKDLSEKQSAHEAELKERDDKIKGYETTSAKMRIAREAGIPEELASRLSGDDEEAMKKDAETLAALFKTADPEPQSPMGKTEPAGNDNKQDAKDAAFKSMLQNMEGDE